MKAFKKAMSLILSLVMLLSLTCVALPASADEVQTVENTKFTLAEGSTSNFTADASAGTVVTDGTKNGYLYFAAATENGYATKWEATGTVTKSTNPYLSFGVRDSFGKTQWFCIFNNYISLQRGWDWSTNVYKQDGVHVVDSPAAAYFAWNNADQGGGKLNYKIVVENDVLKAYFSNDIYPEALAWSLPLTNSTFGGFAPGSEYQMGITWVDPVVLNFSNMNVTASTKYTDTTFHIADISNAVADPANDFIVTNGVDDESNVYFSADENYNSYAKNWRLSTTLSREAKENTNTFTAFAVQDTTGNTQWFCIVGKTLARMRRWDWDDSTRAAAEGTTIIENQAASDYNWSNQDGSKNLNITLVVENDTLKAYFGSSTQTMKLAWDLPLTEEINGGFASGSAYRLIYGNSLPVKTTLSNIRVHTENVVYASKIMVQTDALSIRDPFVLEDNGTYYLYGTSGFGKLEVYTSRDLYMWTKQNPCFVAYGDFFGNAVQFSSVSTKEKASWAPEVYKVNDAYYMLATFTQNTETMNQQGTVMLKANSPLGPFEMWSDGPITPAGHSCLDATLHFENGVPYLIYAHEWQCACRNYNGTGSMDYIQLSEDLKSTVGSSSEWFGANELTSFWDNILGTSSSRTTDGPFVYTDANGQNYLLWSTHLDPSDNNTYAQLATKFSTLGSSVNLKSASLTLQEDNGGHGMIFTDPDGNETLIMHNASNKAALYNVVLGDSGISLEDKTVSPDYIEGWSLTLQDNIGANFYFAMTQDQAYSSEVEFVVDGVSTIVPGSQAVLKDGLYGFAVEVAAAQMTSPISVKLSIGGVLVQEETYTVRQYAEVILKDENNQYPAVTEDLVKAMLNYGAKAQTYFAHNTDNPANAGYEITQFAALPENLESEISMEGSADGVSFYGASLLFKSNVAVRYYFKGDVSGCTFTVEGSENVLTPVQKDGLWYVDIEDILPQELDVNYTVIVTDAEGNQLSVTYGPMYYIARKSAEGSDSLKGLLLAMYNYYVEACDYEYYTSTDGIILITDGYADTDVYAVMSANIKANTALTYGWKNTVAIGVSGNVSWSNYAFQLAYGNSSEQNLVKLNNNMGYDGASVVQEQWYNNAKLEDLFSEGGMDIKVIRMNTRAFLVADMGEGYELIGTMMVPADATTNFNVYNNDTEVQISNVSVQTGKAATMTALNGIDLTLGNNPYIFPIDSDSWTVEGKLAVDFNNLPTSDYRLFAGADGFSQAVAVLAVGGSATNWRVQNQTTWKSYVMDESYYSLLNKDNGGMYVRWIRSGSDLTLWISADGINWQKTQSHTGITEPNLYIKANQDLGAQLLDVTFSSEAVFTQQKKANTMFIPADYTDANYAVLEANIKALDAITYDWNSNIIVSVSGNAKWDQYDFQILYGTSATRNLVKLTNNTAGTFDGIVVTQDQNVNNAAFEKPFSDEGMNIKVVRLNTWAYLLVDMGAGYTVVGKMYIPADQPTQFSVYNGNTAIEISNYSVKTGETAAKEAETLVFANDYVQPLAIPGNYTNANYAVLEANIKALDAITYDWGSNLVVSASGNAKWAKYGFQILYGGNSEKNLVKLTDNTAGTFDGVTVAQEQWINSPAFEKPFSEEGMKIKVVRLDTWAYLLADMGAGYELVGKMYIPADQATLFSLYTSKTDIQISDYSVATGEDAALAALDGISLDVNVVADSFVIPVTGTQWTLEGKVKFSDFASDDDYRLFVSSLKSEWRRMSLAYIYAESTWKGQSVAQIAGNWASAVISDGVNLTGDGLWVRFVRDGAELGLLVSTDRATWTPIQVCDNCGTDASIIYIFESAEQNSVISDLTVRLGLPEATA